MSSLEDCNKYTQNFWDDNILTTNGFDNLVDHVHRTLDVKSSFIELLQSKLAIDHGYAKSLKKSVTSILKAEKSGKFDQLTLMLAHGILNESDSIIKFTEESTKVVVEPLKETFKINSEQLKKNKSECNILIKNRKTGHENAIKACKNFTSKVRAHDLFVKKTQATAEDEKIKQKIAKSLQVVKLAEKESKVSVEMLNQALADYENKFMSFCRFAEYIDISTINSLKDALRHYTENIKSFNQSQTILADKLKLPNDLEIEPYTNKFLGEKGNLNAYTRYAYLIQIGSGEKIEFSINLTVKPQEHPQVSYPSTISKESISAPESNLNEPKMDKHRISEFETSNPPLPPLVKSGIPPGTSLISLYSYDAQNQDELTFGQGEEIIIVSQEDESWYVGRLKNGKVGVFPIAYAKVK